MEKKLEAERVFNFTIKHISAQNARALAERKDPQRTLARSFYSTSRVYNVVRVLILVFCPSRVCLFFEFEKTIFHRQRDEEYREKKQ
jgi:hypothetical protein